MVRFLTVCAVGVLAIAWVGCNGTMLPPDGDGNGNGGGNGNGDGTDGDIAMAVGVFGVLGQPISVATVDELDTFERGKAVSLRRFDLADGLGPAFNVTFCGACHERPTAGGSAGLYRNFFLAGRTTDDGVFVPSESAGDAGGVLRTYDYAPENPARPAVPSDTTIFAQRNPIPFFGVGLLAELSDEEILSRADEDDEDGDGISGRPNYDQGFVGRFGRKSQTISIEGFIRGPLFNHLGITTDPLTDAQRALLPVDSSADSAALRIMGPPEKLSPALQVAAPSESTTDDDGVADPEMSAEDLFDLVSYAMLLAAPLPEALTTQTRRGKAQFEDIGCAACHTPMLVGPRGGLPVYSDLLLHDMGEELADGIVMNDASGSEFRTQPLWGLAAVGPYLHDGRAESIDAAIRAHGGEGQASADAYADLTPQEADDVIEFLRSLGGRDQFSTGLVEPDAPVLGVGEYGGPLRELEGEELARFVRGRELFDRDFGHESGVGQPRFNGDSCRACHFDPVIGGSGPRDVNVIRQGISNGDGEFVSPHVGTILHKETIELDRGVMAQEVVDIFEHRQTPHLFGLGLVGLISDETIVANADPQDIDGDGISGRVSITDGGRVGRFGWKAQVPSIAEFVRDAMAVELGITVETQEGMTFGRVDDNDDTDDPELSATEAQDLAFFLTMLAPPPRQVFDNVEQVETGETLFGEVGCAACHIAELETSSGPARLYSDLLLHEILPTGSLGIEDGSANMWEFRTAPLWGVSQTAPYFHDGAADTLDQAILMHDGEAATSRDDYQALSESDRNAVLAFLSTL